MPRGALGNYRRRKPFVTQMSDDLLPLLRAPNRFFLIGQITSHGKQGIRRQIVRNAGKADLMNDALNCIPITGNRDGYSMVVRVNIFAEPE